MRAFSLTLMLLLTAMSAPAADRVVLLHFSDYHSHAVPFYTERGPSQGGIARAVGYLEREKKRGALVFSGGDMMNKGAPSWSDRYGCVEWPWLDGIVDAMALGNHDVDYGAEAFAACRKAVRYPILSANTEGFDGTHVVTANRRRIGVFAVAGPDFPRLMKDSGLTFSDPVEAARRAVASLQAKKVDAIVMIGHQQTADDYALAKAVPGIDLIFGTHAHITRELVRIDGTSTWFIASGQYLESISRVEIRFGRGGPAFQGTVVPVDRTLGESKRIARRVLGMQEALERDPKYRAMFQPMATLARPLSVAELAALTLRVMKEAASADVALSTVSTFRGPLAAGTLTLEALTASLPYDNEIVACRMTGAAVRHLLEESAARGGADSHAYVDAPEVLEDGRLYGVATTDYLARSYANVLTCSPATTGIRVRAAVARELAGR